MANPRESKNPRDRILLVESDPVVSDLIGRQALSAVGYQVVTALDATTAIAKALQWSPDLIMADLNLPGLSGKDMLVALASQGISTPVIMIGQRGCEADIIQTFRLGASDYLLLPAREAEVVNAVGRVLKQVHDRRERDRLAQQVQQANHELQARVRELTTIFALGKAMTSVTDQAALMDMILDGALRVTQADIGWFMLREDPDKPFLVAAERNLPPALGVRVGIPWDDGVSSLVAMSGEALNIYGDPLRRFKISSMGQSALIEPIKVQNKVLGLLVMVRRKLNPFGASEQHLLDALSDYASVSLVNARLFRTVEERARSLQRLADQAQIGETVNNEILRVVKKELTGPVSAALAGYEQLSKDPLARWRPEQRQALTGIQEQLLHIHQIAEAIAPLQMAKNLAEAPQANLTELVAQSVRRMQPYAQPAGLSLATQLPSGSLVVSAESGLITQALDGLLCAAVRHSASGSQIGIAVQKAGDGQAHVGHQPMAYLLVRCPGWAMDTKQAEALFEDAAGTASQRLAAERGVSTRFGGVGIRLGLVKEIITRQNGILKLDNQPGKGAAFHVYLPLAR